MSSYLDKTGLERFWAAIKSKFAPKNQGVQYIRGTWTAATGTWTGVSKDSELYDGKQIILYMPFGGSGNATLNLTLANGTTTGEKNVYFEGTTRFTTHKGQNSQLPLIYHSGLKLSNGTTYEGWWYLANRDTTRTAATAAPGKVASSSAVGTSTNYARQDHTHGIDLATGDSNGQVKIAGTNVSVKGWNNAATYDVQTTVANDAKLPTGAAVKSFVEGKGYVTTDTKNTTGSTDTSSKIFLIGATSQAANPQTYSDNEIYATSGVLTTKSVQVGGTAATIQYNSATDAIDFIFD